MGQVVHDREEHVEARLAMQATRNGRHCQELPV